MAVTKFESAVSEFKTNLLEIDSTLASVNLDQMSQIASGALTSADIPKCLWLLALLCESAKSRYESLVVFNLVTAATKNVTGLNAISGFLKTRAADDTVYKDPRLSNCMESCKTFLDVFDDPELKGGKIESLLNKTSLPKMKIMISNKLNGDSIPFDPRDTFSDPSNLPSEPLSRDEDRDTLSNPFVSNEELATRSQLKTHNLSEAIVNLDNYLLLRKARVPFSTEIHLGNKTDDLRTKLFGMKRDAYIQQLKTKIDAFNKNGDPQDLNKFIDQGLKQYKSVLPGSSSELCKILDEIKKQVNGTTPSVKPNYSL